MEARRSLAYDNEATVEFEPIERPLNLVEEELAFSLNEDQCTLEGLDKAIQQSGGMGC